LNKFCQESVDAGDVSEFEVERDGGLIAELAVGVIPLYPDDVVDIAPRDGVEAEFGGRGIEIFRGYQDDIPLREKRCRDGGSEVDRVSERMSVDAEGIFGEESATFDGEGHPAGFNRKHGPFGMQKVVDVGPSLVFPGLAVVAGYDSTVSRRGFFIFGDSDMEPRERVGMEEPDEFAFAFDGTIGLSGAHTGDEDIKDAKGIEDMPSVDREEGRRADLALVGDHVGNGVSSDKYLQASRSGQNAQLADGFVTLEDGLNNDARSPLIVSRIFNSTVGFESIERAAKG